MVFWTGLTVVTVCPLGARVLSLFADVSCEYDVPPGREYAHTL